MCGSLLMFTIAGSMFIFSYCVNIFILIKKHSGAARYLTWAKLWLSDCQLFFRYRFWFHSPHQGCSFSLVGTKMDVWKLNWTAELVIYSSGLKASTGHCTVYALAGDFRSFGRTPVPGYISLAGDRCACWHGKYILCLIFSEKPPVITLLYCSL